jgi:hypothetical protein
LDTRQDCRHIVCWAPSVLQNIKTQFASGVDVWVEHLTDKLHCWWLIWVLFLELHDQSKSTIFEGCVRRSDDHSIPVDGSVSITQQPAKRLGVSHHVITLSATGDADTPAGGSVCMRWTFCQYQRSDRVLRGSSATNLEVSHQTTTSRGRHDGELAWPTRIISWNVVTLRGWVFVCCSRVGRSLLTKVFPAISNRRLALVAARG